MMTTDDVDVRMARMYGWGDGADVLMTLIADAVMIGESPSGWEGMMGGCLHCNDHGIRPSSPKFVPKFAYHHPIRDQLNLIHPIHRPIPQKCMLNLAPMEPRVAGTDTFTVPVPIPVKEARLMNVSFVRSGGRRPATGYRLRGRDRDRDLDLDRLTIPHILVDAPH
jgi:hypothetical protein